MTMLFGPLLRGPRAASGLRSPPSWQRLRSTPGSVPLHHAAGGRPSIPTFTRACWGCAQAQGRSSRCDHWAGVQSVNRARSDKCSSPDFTGGSGAAAEGLARPGVMLHLWLLDGCQQLFTGNMPQECRSQEVTSNSLTGRHAASVLQTVHAPLQKSRDLHAARVRSTRPRPGSWA